MTTDERLIYIEALLAVGTGHRYHAGTNRAKTVVIQWPILGAISRFL